MAVLNATGGVDVLFVTVAKCRMIFINIELEIIDIDFGL